MKLLRLGIKQKVFLIQLKHQHMKCEEVIFFSNQSDISISRNSKCNRLDKFPKHTHSLITVTVKDIGTSKAKFKLNQYSRQPLHQ